MASQHPQEPADVWLEECNNGPLCGRRIVDLSQGAAGPWASQLIADLGGDVIKIEPPEGDWCRRLGPPYSNGQSTVFLSLNRNKRSVVLDLKSPQDLAVAKHLIRNADVLIESLRPGTIDQLGLGDEVLASINSAIIACHISAFGPLAPGRHKAGVDGVMQAVSGLMSTIGLPDDEPAKAGLAGDMMTGTLAALAIVSELANSRPRRSGPGRLDVNILDSLLALQTTAMTGYLTTGQEPVRLGSHAPYAAPNGAYPTKDGYIMLAAYSEAKWTRFCDLVGMDPATKEFSTNTKRVENRALLYRRIAAKLEKRTSAAWQAIFEDHDVMAEEVLTYPQVSEHAQLSANASILEFRDTTYGVVRTVANPIWRDGTRLKCRRPAPVLDAHGPEIRAKLTAMVEATQ